MLSDPGGDVGDPRKGLDHLPRLHLLLEQRRGPFLGRGQRPRRGPRGEQRTGAEDQQAGERQADLRGGRREQLLRKGGLGAVRRHPLDCSSAASRMARDWSPVASEMMYAPAVMTSGTQIRAARASMQMKRSGDTPRAPAET